MVSLFLLLACNLSYIVDLFAALHELTSASARTLLKLASSVRALLKPYGDTLRCFPSFALRISTAHDVCVISARKWARARTKSKRFPSNWARKRDKCSFSLKRARWPHFLFYKFNENNILNNWEKNWQKSIATFLSNAINATNRDVTGPTEQVQIMFPLKDKTINW